jgi:hypothetical protein
MKLGRTTLAFLRFFEAQVIAPAGKQGQTSKVEHAYKQSFSDSTARAAAPAGNSNQRLSNLGNVAYNAAGGYRQGFRRLGWFGVER